MDNIPQHIISVLRNSVMQQLTDQERSQLDIWLAENDAHRQLYQKLHQKDLLASDLEKLNRYDWQKSYEAVVQALPLQYNLRPSRIKHLRTYWLAASIVLLMALGIGAKYFMNEFDTVPEKNIVPATNQAQIVMGNGQVMNINTHAATNIVDSTWLNKLLDSAKLRGDSDLLSFTVVTPIGGKYAFKLPDGSKVWMNANSEMKYQQGDTLRTVMLKGEAYFEVAKRQYEAQNGILKRKPFVVKTTQMKVEVLGTHFDVSAYEGHAEKATLTEGRVQVTAKNQTMVLHPGQRAILSNGALHKVQIDKASGTELKNAFFVFRNETLGQIMTELANWYNVKVVYLNNQIKDEKFEGMLSRTTSLNDVISLLQSTNKLSFKFKGRTVYIDSATAATDK